MLNKPESKWVLELRNILAKSNINSTKISAGQYQEPGLPDLYIFSKEKNISIWAEIKLKPKLPTPKQLAFLNKLPKYSLCIRFTNFLESEDHEIINYTKSDKVNVRTMEQIVSYILNLDNSNVT